MEAAEFDCVTAPISVVATAGAAEGALSAVALLGANDEMPVDQSHVQVQVQLQAHGCCQLAVNVCPSARVQVQSQVHMPGLVGAASVGAAGGALFVGSCHAQFQVDVSVGATSVALAASGGVHVPLHTQFHTHGPVSGAPAAVPGMTRETFVFSPSVATTTPRSGVVPTAAALFVCSPAPSLPGLAMRMDTLVFAAPVCSASAAPVDEIEVGAVAGLI
jgi:hypothetical protein